MHASKVSVYYYFKMSKCGMNIHHRLSAREYLPFFSLVVEHVYLSRANVISPKRGE